MEEKYFCRKCKGLRNQKSLFEKKILEGDAHDYFQWLEKYIVLECLGCETVSFLKVYGDTDMVYHDDEGNQEYYFDNNIYPLFLEKGDELKHKSYLPESISGIYAETISAFKSNSFILTAGGLRAIIEALCNHLKIKKDNLQNRIDLLHKKGHLTLSESKRLHSIRFLGNDALHEIEKPKKEHLYLLLELINHLLSNLFINDKIIKGKLDTIIDNFEEFNRLVKTKITSEMVGKEMTLLEIINKAKRLIPKSDFPKYEKKFIEECELGKYDFLELKSKKAKDSILKVIKEPTFFSFGIK